MKVQKRSSLFQLAIKACKYYLLALVGFVIACLLAFVFESFAAIAPILPFLGQGFFRCAMLLLCWIAIAVVLESMRS